LVPDEGKESIENHLLSLKKEFFDHNEDSSFFAQLDSFWNIDHELKDLKKYLETPKENLNQVIRKDLAKNGPFF
jgi:hypothetical protein